ncbi:cytochrome P450 3A6-like [Diadema antillarum]|uniref:cytochrome P450 3A6-like n=1 Tax=Diadema antillarum TaxID=105358 RepID=UPI003A874297
MEVEIFGWAMPLSWFLLLAAVILYFVYDTWCHTYWRRKGVVSESAWPVIGCMREFSKGIPQVFTNMGKRHGKVYGFYSFYDPVLVITEPDMLRDIMVKNFGNFHSRVRFPLTNKEFIEGVGTLEGERWKEVRNLLTPTFSGSKMKLMSSLVNDSADNLLKNIGKEQNDKGYMECRKLFGAFVMDTIGSCAFGLNIDSQGRPNDPFVTHAQRAFRIDQNSPIFVISAMFPSIGRLLAECGYGFVPRDVVQFFCDVTLKAVALRKQTVGAVKKKLVDFLQLMLNAQSPSSEVDQLPADEKDDEDDIHADIERHHNMEYHANKYAQRIQLSDTELIGQAMTFFTAGYETTNTLLGFVFYLLSTHPEIQEKLIEEVDEMTPSRDSVGYTSIATMPYLDQVVCETLRLYPPAAVTNRMCHETFTYKDLTIEKGVQVFIPIYNIQRDGDYWADPDKFDPSRFSKANREKHHPFSWIPFGAGPRNCIGMRFALMEAKMAIARVLQKYRFETCPQTEIPLKLGNNGFLAPPDGVTLRAVARKDAVC